MLFRIRFANQYIAAFTACFSMAVSGSCYSWVTPILHYLLGPTSEIPMTSSQSSWMVSTIAIGNLITPVPASFLADSWGRKPSILFTGPLFFLSWVLVLAWPSIISLYIARLIQGFSVGIALTVVPLYIGEIASPEIRGSITSLFHSTWYLGHLIQYSLGSFLPYRTYTYVTASLPIIFLIIFCKQPESPYFLLMKKKEFEASNSLAHLRGFSEANSVNEELQSMIKSVNNEMRNKASWKDIIQTAADRRSLYIVVGLGAIRVLNGLIPVMTYSTQTFSKINLANFNNTLLSEIVTPSNITILYGGTIFICSFFVTLIADLSGRRVLLMFSCLGACINLFLAGGYFYLSTNTDIDVSNYSWFPVLVIVLFSLFVTLGLGPVSIMYQSEMFLSNTRGIASSIAAINVTANIFFLLKVYQVIADSFGIYLVFWLFSVFCLFASFWIYITVPETRGKTFTEIRQELYASINKHKGISESKTTVISVVDC